MTDITVPTLGESVTEATVGKWMKAAGDMPSPRMRFWSNWKPTRWRLKSQRAEAGTLSEIVAEEGDTVEIGALLGRVGAANGDG